MHDIQSKSPILLACVWSREPPNWALNIVAPALINRNKIMRTICVLFLFCFGRSYLFFLLRLVRSQELPVFVPILTDIIPKLQTYSIDKRKQLKWVHIPPSEWKQSTRKGIKLDVVAHNALVHAVWHEWRGPNIAVGLIELLREDSTTSGTNKEEIWGFEKKKHEEQEDQQIRSGLHEQEVPYGRERPMKWGELEKKTQLGLGNLG